MRILVIDNDGGGIFGFLPQAAARKDEFEALLGTPRGVDAAKVAASSASPTGGESLEELPAALLAGTGLISVRTDRRENAETASPPRRCGGGRDLGEQRQQRPELDLGLGQLGRGIGAGDDADAGVEMGLAVAQQGAAQGDAELAVFGRVHPADRAGVPAAVHLLELGDRACGGRASGSPPTAGVGCSMPASSTAERGSASWATIGVARCWMLATLTISGSALGLDPDRVRAQRAGDALGDDRVLAAVLVAAQQLLAEVVVDGRVGAAAGRAGEGDGGDAGPERRSSSSGLAPMKAASGRAAAEAEAGGELLAHRAEDGGGVVGGAGARRAPRGRARPSTSPPPRSARSRPRSSARTRPAGGRC